MQSDPRERSFFGWLMSMPSLEARRLCIKINNIWIKLLKSPTSGSTRPKKGIMEAKMMNEMWVRWWARKSYSFFISTTFFLVFVWGRSQGSVTVKWQEICQLFIKKSILHVKAQKTGDKAARIGRIPSHGHCAPTPVVIITEIKERVAKTLLFITFNLSLTEKKHSQRKKRNDDIERDIF